MKTAENIEQAFRELVPKLQELAVQPVRNEDDLTERMALRCTVFDLVGGLRNAGMDPNEVAPGWGDCFITLTRENARAERELEQGQSASGLLEANRRAMVQRGEMPVVLPPEVKDATGRPLYGRVFGGVPLQPEPGPAGTEAPAGGQRLRLSEVLARYLDYRETQHGDRRADSEVAPIIKFAIELLGDPVMHDLKGDDFLKLKKALPDIPTKFGFGFDDSAELYRRWIHVRDHGWTFNRDGKHFQFKRTSETTINVGWKIALTSVWQFAIGLRFAAGPLPDFEISTPKNPGAVERDAFRNDELLAFLKSPAFGGCAGRARMWVEGKYFYQGFFYWGELIGLFSGMRPGETSQLRCRDIMDLHGRPHFRFAILSVEEEEKAQHAPVSGGNDGKTDSAYRWVSLHWLLIRLGIVERRDAIVADCIERKIKEAGGRHQLSDEQFAQIEKEAGEQWLFPDWPVYVKKTGEIKWAHALGKACRYAFIKLKMERPGLTQYSARHFFKGLIDEVRGLAERSRKVILGHSTDGDVTTKYGPKLLTEEESLLVHRLSNRHIWRMALVLIRAKRKAEKGELKVIDAWRNDLRSNDEKFQTAMRKRAELYR